MARLSRPIRWLLVPVLAISLNLTPVIAAETCRVKATAGRRACCQGKTCHCGAKCACAKSRSGQTPEPRTIPPSKPTQLISQAVSVGLVGNAVAHFPLLSGLGTHVEPLPLTLQTAQVRLQI